MNKEMSFFLVSVGLLLLGVFYYNYKRLSVYTAPKKVLPKMPEGLVYSRGYENRNYNKN